MARKCIHILQSIGWPFEDKGLYTMECVFPQELMKMCFNFKLGRKGHAIELNFANVVIA